MTDRVDDKPKETFVPAYSASLRLGVPTAWLVREASAGRVPFLRVGKRMLFNLALVEKCLIDMAQNNVSTDSASGDTP
jgi:hypothetical protein